MSEKRNWGTYTDKDGIERPKWQNPAFMEKQGRINELSTDDDRRKGAVAGGIEKARRKSFRESFTDVMEDTIHINGVSLTHQEALLRKLINASLKCNQPTAIARAIELSAKFLGELPSDKIEMQKSSLSKEDVEEWDKFMKSMIDKPKT